MRHKRGKPNVRLMLDSGAFTAWSQGKEINLKDYIKYIKDNRGIIDTYFNLDVIPGGVGGKPTVESIETAAAASYRNLEKMREAGLDPIPVYHEGERFYWLHKMLEDGCKYIGLGGLGGKSPEAKQLWMDQSFTILTEKDGRPKIKVHGLGIASFDLLRRYPWYTCDATSWALTSAYGNIFVPPFSIYRHGEWKSPDYVKNPSKITISKVERAKGIPKDHILKMGPLMRDLVKTFLEDHVGTTIEEVSENYVERARTVVYYMLRFQENLGEVRFKHRQNSFFSN